MSLPLRVAALLVPFALLVGCEDKCKEVQLPSEYAPFKSAVPGGSRVCRAEAAKQSEHPATYKAELTTTKGELTLEFPGNSAAWASSEIDRSLRSDGWSPVAPSMPPTHSKELLADYRKSESASTMRLLHVQIIDKSGTVPTRAYVTTTTQQK